MTSPAVDPLQLFGLGELTAEALPPPMAVPDPRGPYRAPLLQYVADWNVSSDRAAMTRTAPIYEGDDPLLLPAIAALVHTLAARDDVGVPEWVVEHRHPIDIPLFEDTDDG